MGKLCSYASIDIISLFLSDIMPDDIKDEEKHNN